MLTEVHECSRMFTQVYASSQILTALFFYYQIFVLKVLGLVRLKQKIGSKILVVIQKYIKNITPIF